jgi:hypothetical protein
MPKIQIIETGDGPIPCPQCGKESFKDFCTTPTFVGFLACIVTAGLAYEGPFYRCTNCECKFRILEDGEDD